MQTLFRTMAIAVALITGLAGCGGSGSGGDEAPSQVVVSRSAGGTVTAVANGGSRTLTVGFNSSDGRVISRLRVSGLSTLPAGWSGPADFSCATVGSGNGCLLNLTYAPTAIASGTLVLTYAYTDSAGGAGTGSIDIPFAATVSNNVVATTLPAGQVAVVIDSQQPISQQTVVVIFTPDDGNPASALSITSVLPADWASMAGFTCASVSASGTCRMNLAYTPTAAGSGTLALEYSYLDNSGVAKTGTLNIPYIATTANNVVAAASPSATVSARVGDLPEAVTLTFTTDDGNPASGFAITSGLPSGWSGTPGFSCSNVGSGTGCQTMLHYQPLAAASGTLNVAYSYSDNSGVAKTGSINIGYSATRLYTYAAALGGFMSYCEIDGTDGGLDSCTTTANPGLINATGGITFHGEKAYVSDTTASVFVCNLDSDGGLSACATSGSGFAQPLTLASTETHLYAANAASTNITYCEFDSDGSLINCGQIATTLSSPTALAFRNGYVYISDATLNTVTICAVSPATGEFSSCAATGSGFDQPVGIEFADDYAYVANQANNTVSACAINSDGTFGVCSAASAGTGPSSIAILGNRAYVASAISGSIDVCDLDRTTGMLSLCADAGPGTFLALPIQIVIH